MTFTVLTAEFMHESNTFSRLPTALGMFRADTLLMGDEAIAVRREANTELAGFLDVGRARGWSVIHAVSAHATPGGRVTKDAYDHIAGAILAAARNNRDRLDGIALGLHGAMVPDFTDDGEGWLLARLREIVGPDLPIAVTLDLHAMVSADMVRDAQILVSYRTYPHIDMRETGAKAAALLHRTMAGKIAPRTLRAHVPMLDEANAGRTDIPATRALYDRAAAAETGGVLAVSVNAGFTGADVACVGPTVLAVHDRNDPSAEARAREVAREVSVRGRVEGARRNRGHAHLAHEVAAEGVVVRAGQQPVARQVVGRSVHGGRDPCVVRPV